MTSGKQKSPQQEANRLSIMLRHVLGEDRFPVDVEALAREVSRNNADPIGKIVGGELPGFEGMLRPHRKRPEWHIVYNDENPGEMWDDTLMMSVLPLAKIGLLLGRPQYIEEAKRQFLVHIKYLFDKKTGLWFHGWNFNGRHNFAGALWARGNCWVTIAIPEIIELLDLPEGDALRMFLIDTLAAQVKTLSETQDEDTGLWHTLIVDPSSYLEASATAGFAYGILKGVRKGYLPRRYEAVGIRAVKGVLANIDEDGELKQVSFGTAMGDTEQFYKDIALTSMPYGQSLAMIALGEFLRTYI